MVVVFDFLAMSVAGAGVAGADDPEVVAVQREIGFEGGIGTEEIEGGGAVASLPLLAGMTGLSASTA